VHQILCDDATFLSRIITGDERWIYGYGPETKQQSNGKVKSKVKNMLIILTSKGLFTKNSFWQAKQSVLHITVTFYSDCVKMCEAFMRQKNGLLHHEQFTVSHFLSTRELLIKNNMAIVFHPPYFSMFPWLKIKLKGHHFDTIEVIDAELQAVLNTLTEHDFQDAFKKWQKRWEWCVDRR
jgi:hypothetical protein